MNFWPCYSVIDRVDALPISSQMNEEVMLYQASIDFARLSGGPIVQQFLDRLPLKGNVIIDVRKHYLNAGQYPAIPGYHLDWIPRKNKGAEPDLSVIPDYEHVILAIGETSITEFVDQEFEAPIIEPKPFWHINNFIKENILYTWSPNSGEMVYFTSGDWHRATPARQSEWRLLIRASRVDHAKPVNKIRNQAQVYIPTSEANW